MRVQERLIVKDGMNTTLRDADTGLKAIKEVMNMAVHARVRWRSAHARDDGGDLCASAIERLTVKMP